jgi:GT2 family glycosyltransferase
MAGAGTRAERHPSSSLLAPVAVRTIELDRTEPLELAREGDPYRSALLIATRAGVPVAVQSLMLDGGTRIEPAELRGLFSDPPPETAASVPRYGTVPSVSVVVTTCAQPESLLATVASVLACDPAPLEVIVVENRPQGSPVAAALGERFGDDDRVRYLEESRVGLSWARNTGINASTGDVVAVTDDDVLVNPRWIDWLGRAFASEPDVACVTGLILPADLETDEQVFIEQFAGFGKGFERRVFHISTPTSPLAPFAAGEYGSGACTAIRREIAQELGGFDQALGAGTIARGGEDLDLYVRLLLTGHTIVYEPAAMIFHRHPDATEHVRREVFCYGVGLSAMVMKQMVAGQALAVLRRLPRALRYLLDPTSRKNVRKGPEYDHRYDWIERAGIAAGPFAYLASRRQQRGYARTSA